MLHRSVGGPYRARLRADGTFWLELSFCNDHGIPHSELLTWDPVDRAKQLAFTLEKNLKCPMCGTAGWEWDPEQGGSKFAYEPVGVHCQGCYVKDAASDDTQRTPGLTIELHPTGTQESAERALAAERRQRASAERKRAKRR